MTIKKRPVATENEAENIANSAEKTVLQPEEKIIEFDAEAKEVLKNNSSSTSELSSQTQSQLQQFKYDLLQKIDAIKGQLGYSQKEYAELKTFIKTEIHIVLTDLSKLSKEIKADVGQLSVKHKDSLAGTLKRSKQNTIEAWKKVIPAKPNVGEDVTHLKS
jgi:hypothetical protein